MGIVLKVFGYCWVTLGLAIIANTVASIERGASDLAAFSIGASLVVFVAPGAYCWILGNRKEEDRAADATNPHRRRRERARGSKRTLPAPRA
jgi:hypothetical protein